MADEVASLMEERLRLRGAGLGVKLRKGRRLLPRRVRSAAERLAAAALMSENPKLSRRVDQKAAASAHQICMQHLGAIDHKHLRASRRIGLAGSIASSLLVVIALVGTVLVWRGYL